MTGVHLLAAISILVELADGRRESIGSGFLGAMRRLDDSVTRRILGKLRRAGLVESRSGPGGGARLARDPASITLLDVVEAVAPVRPLTARQLALFPHLIGDCPRQVILATLESADGARREVLAAMSIGDVVLRIARVRQRERGEALRAKRRPAEQRGRRDCAEASSCSRSHELPAGIDGRPDNGLDPTRGIRAVERTN